MVAPIGASETAWADFCFISEQPGHPRKRPRELQQSKARAHAATVVWKRKMSKKQRSSSAARTDPVETRSARYPFSDYACSTGLRVDGFYCLPFTQDQQDLEILDWHRQTILSKQTIQWDILSISAWAPNAEASLAESTMFSHASLAVASLKFERRSIINANPSNTTLRHSNLAVSMLRDQLKQNELVIDPALLCTMVYLAIFEVRSDFGYVFG
ncbi:hypothetical protein H2200_011270 [Cladophialophora chaetospira]|uniref:Transcription factor domain-containing protein n=1 Tax=Cladophialophora chaetospira TaxID=386627 RepID=A0AA38X0B2_9EURO|nr:hypothetical protein H2200_011270 [Cladophialophora chaetospira]